MNVMLKPFLAALLLSLFSTQAWAGNRIKTYQCTDTEKTSSIYDSKDAGRPGFYHQELRLAGGKYEIYPYSSQLSQYQFRFNAFIYERDHSRQDWRRTRQVNNVLSTTHSVDVGDLGGQVLIQIVKTDNRCAGCSVRLQVTPMGCYAKRDRARNQDNLDWAN